MKPKDESQSETGEAEEKKSAAGEIYSWSFVEGRITSFYDPAALLFLERRRDLTPAPHSTVFVFTAASTTPFTASTVVASRCLPCVGVRYSVCACIMIFIFFIDHHLSKTTVKKIT